MLTRIIDNFFHGDARNEAWDRALDHMNVEYEKRTTASKPEFRKEVVKKLDEKGFEKVESKGFYEFWKNDNEDYFVIRDSGKKGKSISSYYLGLAYDGEIDGAQIMEDCICREYVEFLADGFGMMGTAYIGATIDSYLPGNSVFWTGMGTAFAAQFFDLYTWAAEVGFNLLSEWTGEGYYTEEHNEFYKKNFCSESDAIHELTHMKEGGTKTKHEKII